MLAPVLLAAALAAGPAPADAETAGVPAPPTDVDTSPLPIKAVRAFEFLTFDRPILLTHPGDGSDRVIVVTQKGPIFQFPNDPDVEEATPFGDLSDRVVYNEKQNEEGLLGLAFHPEFKTNGRVFIYYTTTDAPHTSVISEFKAVGEGLDQRLDADSEREIFRLQQPYWNHNAGTILFGPDGMFYVAFGDGGAGGDPLDNGQNVGTVFGAMLRLDVDAEPAEGKAYAVPADNPHVGKPGALPEIYAHGFRNPWRFSFDAKTGALWLADVGQDKWEEINVVEPGKNYGWSVFEGFHPFPPDRKPAYTEGEGMTFPVWEYDHETGKSITGGVVYRGSKVPALQGKYLYGDYVSGLLWALELGPDGKAKSNRPLTGHKHPMMSFGEGPDGEAYFMTTFGQLWTFAAE
ncbi:PQQ-dependent sugar dehydrogenase [Alienimonas californiensis]|uniref:Soluble aldose sugar dehydrogenase YliI n=1 Tax=Alienimonas californiensis TaxID=2527989 RepID=A0A517P576_9PLAN|nr:PQQ-dependent sugar dehydrogenase [Alienimonas californiensis]QDT14521.1 Soluble aldose sugar dehydrogenase YliI precursor [Alienimonas californiensis]